MDSPFDVLLIDSDAEEREVDRAYRRRVKEAHPDQGGSAEEFQRVRAAYKAIKSAEGDGEIDFREPDASEGETAEESEREAAGSGGDDQQRPEGSQVEYLNYEVLDDRGWNLDDDDLFEKASAADLDPADHGQLSVRHDESLLQAAENRGFAWPYACRGGACANCAVAVTEGEMTLPTDHILPSSMTDRGIRLSCNGRPATDGMKVVYNLKHLPELEELRLPPYPFEQAHFDD